MRSEGAALLHKIGGKQDEIARRCGVSQGMVSFWVSGKNKPGYENRKILLARFKIPMDSWDKPAIPGGAPAA